MIDYGKFKTKQEIDDELARLDLFCVGCGKIGYEFCEKCNTEILRNALHGLRRKLEK
jgi:rRNA maturation endonuclease Nob1